MIYFQVQVDVNFPLQLMTYLETGSSPAQTYVVSQPKTLRIQFPLLSPGFNYGRFCVRESPLMYAYSMMGRDVHVSSTTCHFDALKTRSVDFTDQMLADQGEYSTLKVKITIYDIYQHNILLIYSHS